MARIKCRTPSTGKPINYILQDVTQSFSLLVEAPDFSIPDPSGNVAEQFTVDPLDDTRAIRPGEIFFLTPVAVRNKDTETHWVEVQVLTESGEQINIARIDVPGNDTAFIPLQGRSIFKRDPDGSIGDQIRVRADTENVFDVWLSGEEKLSSEHISNGDD